MAIDVDGLVRRGSAILKEAGVDSPDHDASVLLAHSCGLGKGDVDRARLIGETVDSLVDSPRDALCAYRALIERRAAREPLQTIIGYTRFRGLTVRVGPGVFIPRPETELVVQEAIDWLVDRRIESPRVVDLCAGSGAIGLSMVSEVANAQVWAVELSTEALAWATRNSTQLIGARPDIAGAYHLVAADATASSTLRELDGTVDVVVTNPPYVPDGRVPEQPEVRDHDPSMALYGRSRDGTAVPRLIIERSCSLLRPGGLLVMEHDITQGGLLAAHAEAHGFGHVRTMPDWTHRPRALVAVKG
ncbi:peptide chain release factor N(5)-glutamine methyltransferase [uncultured Bifidobacterium sp.]|uniref:peptide chain release factor N(5)-glutamine methyltransferase n=1 Tax=uncultured Bifidobacterium sp. TaxID=165187 RepID=UPI00262CEFC8|nr:peptide chain release factor N(5)-glutamine methyltransferase [uncultured Bifidobacterium sp.]